MKKVCLLCGMLLIAAIRVHSQSVAQKLATVVSSLENDTQLAHGLLGLYVMDAKTGNLVYERNGQLGLTPASTQKIITSATTFELLGSTYRFKTYIAHDKDIKDGRLSGNLYIIGNGDPTLGSWRWNSTTEQAILENITSILEKKSIKQVDGDVMIDDVSYTFQPIPDGWIWQDIGNYYGAGAWSLNWRENQYDLVLRSDKNVGGPTSVVKTTPGIFDFKLTNLITAGKKNSGDNGYIYASPFSVFGFSTGTIPADEESFTISGSMSHPPRQFAKTLEQKLTENGIVVMGEVKLHSSLFIAGQPAARATRNLDSISSPAFDSVNYWFMQKSINLYGEALVKAIAFKARRRQATTDQGVDIIKDFWKDKGIEKSALNIIDGSGLSPQNRVTTHALVRVLQHAKTRSWFNAFYLAMPSFNGMKIKSGSISGARSFAGYHTSTTGKEYIFAIIVNNYDGSSAEMVKKMYKVLDVLK